MAACALAAIITTTEAEASEAATTDATRLRARPTTASSAVFAVSARLTRSGKY
ncbi:hypothetical protein GCM10009555_067640 [Acrocarpospora macrocephala]